MKIIEGLKLIKELQVKATDLRAKIALNCAHLSVETPAYGGDQRNIVSGWLQSHDDLTREIAKLHVRIAKTNLATMVTISVDGNTLTKSITEWVLRRRTLAKLDEAAWGSLTDRNLKEGQWPSTGGGPPTAVAIVRYFDPKQRDAKITTYKAEPGLIDRTLEVTNATNDLLE